MLRLTETLVCEVGDQTVALPLEWVDRVVHAVAFTAVPGAPAHQPGTLDLHGEPRPLYVLRALLGQPAREPDPDDQIVLARAGPQPVALLVDRARGVQDGAEGVTRTVRDMPSFLAAAETTETEGAP